MEAQLIAGGRAPRPPLLLIPPSLPLAERSAISHKSAFAHVTTQNARLGHSFWADQAFARRPDSSWNLSAILRPREFVVGRWAHGRADPIEAELGFRACCGAGMVAPHECHLGSRLRKPLVDDR